MSWYPIIDEVGCIKCGVCRDQCQHDVYDKHRGSQAVVIAPEKCILGCSLCGCSCPTGAISFHSPDKNNPQRTKVCCGCGQQCTGSC